MHDPLVQVFEVKLPIPVRSYPVALGFEKRWSLRARRWTNPAPEYLGKRMKRWYRPGGYELAAFGRRIRWATLCEIWHDEPGGADSGTVCKGMKGSQLTWHNVRWAVKHRRHLQVWWPYWRRVRAWLFLRCARCNQRFHWKEPKFGLGWDSKETYHEGCHDAVHMRSQLDDAYSVLDGSADLNAQFRVQYVMRHRLEKDVADA